MHTALHQLHGITLGVSVQLEYMHPLIELKEMHRSYLHIGKNRLGDWMR